MNAWVMGCLLTLALAAGLLAGWFGGKGAGVRPPNPYVATLVLLVGSVGGPLATYRLLGAGLWSYVIALLVAGLAAGVIFWPMGEKQGKRKWL